MLYLYVTLSLVCNVIILYFSDTLYDIDAKYNEKISHAYASSTTRNFMYQWSQFIEFCGKHKLQMYPPVPQNVARFLTMYSGKVNSFNTVNNMLSSIRTFYRLSGFSLNVESPEIDLFVRACKRTMSSDSKPKNPIEVGHLLLIRKCVNFQNPTECAFFTALLVQFFGCLRVSNLLPVSASDLSSNKFLRRKDITMSQGNLLLTLQWSKTLQNSDNIFVIPIAGCSGSILDPYSHYASFQLAFPVPISSPSFSYCINGQLHVLTRYQYINYLKYFLERIGVDSHNFSSHSIRRGSASLMYQSQVPTHLIKLHGTWRSSAYQKYLEFTYEQKLTPTVKMHQRINQLLK